VFIESDGGEILCAADSIEVQPLNSGDRIEIKRSEFSAKIVRLGYSNFYKKVRERLLWGERLNF